MQVGELDAGVFKNLAIDQYVNGTMDRLRELSSPSDIDCRRCVYELLQNAKDSIVGDPKRTSVRVDFTVRDDYVIFKHNGSPFTEETLYALIFKYSKGKRDKLDAVRQAIGRFGTGFMTTHVLSTIVEIETDFDEGEGQPLSGRSLILNRDGYTDKAVKEGLHATLNSRKEIPPPGYTSFRYNLRSETNKKARDYTADAFEKSIVETLLFCPTIEEATMDNRGKMLSVKRLGMEDKGEFEIHKLLVVVDGVREEKSFIVVNHRQKSPEITQYYETPREMSMSLALEFKGNKIVNHTGKTCLFCSFPFIGSEQHQLPFLFNCIDFEPDTERQTLLLSGGDFGVTSSGEKRVTPAGINKAILKAAVPQFANLVRYAQKELGITEGLDVLTNGLLTAPVIKNMNAEWYENEFMAALRRRVEDTCLILLENGEKVYVEKACFANFSEQPDPEKQKELHSILCYLEHNMVAFDTAKAWSGKLWKNLKCVGIRRIAQGFSRNQRTIDWEKHNRAVAYVHENELKLMNEFPLIPDMNGNLHRMTDRLYTCKDVSKSLITILNDLEIGWRSDHVDDRFTVPVVRAEHRQQDMVHIVNQAVKANDRMAYKLILYVPAGDKNREKMYTFAKCFLSDHVYSNTRPCENISATLWEEADEKIITDILKRFSEKEDTNEKEMDTLNTFIELIIQKYPTSYLNRWPILPNMHMKRKKLSMLYNRNPKIPLQFYRMLTRYAGIDIDDSLLHDKITAVKCEKMHEITTFIDPINQVFSTVDEDKKNGMTDCIMSLIPETDCELSQRLKNLFDLYSQVISRGLVLSPVGVWDERFWSSATAHAKNRIIARINTFQTLKDLKRAFRMSDDETVAFLNRIYREIDSETINTPAQNGRMHSPTKLLRGMKVPDTIKELVKAMDPENVLARDDSCVYPGIENNHVPPMDADILFNVLDGMTDPKKNKGKNAKEFSIIKEWADPESIRRDKKKTISEDPIVIQTRLKMMRKMCAGAVWNRLRELQTPKDHEKGRWILELIQNARDTAAKYNRKVNVTLHFTDNEVTFKHDAPPFTDSEKCALTYKVSEGKSDRGNFVGRFGTGFLSTHVLSRKVYIESDVLHEGETQPVGFTIKMYRDGGDEKALIQGLEKMEESEKETAPHGHTLFRYKLKTPLSQECRKEGVKVLINHVHQIMCFEPVIESITIIEATKNRKEGHETIHKYWVSDRSEEQCTIQCTRNKDRFSPKTFLVAKSDLPSVKLTSYYKEKRMMRIMSAVEIHDNCLVEPKDDQSLVFCTLPLTGKDNRILPIFINSPDFELTTERDALVVDGELQDDDGNVTTTGINQEILTFLVQENTAKIIRLCEDREVLGGWVLAKGLKDVSTKPDIDKIIAEEASKKTGQAKKKVLNTLDISTIKNEFRKAIENARIFRTNNGFKSMKEICIPVFSSKKTDPNRALMSLLQKFHQNLVVYDDAGNWSDVIWPLKGSKSTPTAGEDELCKRITQYGTVGKLPFEKKWNFVNEVIDYLMRNSPEKLKEHAVIPDQYEAFKKATDIKISVDRKPEIQKLWTAIGLETSIKYVNAHVRAMNQLKDKGIVEREDIANPEETILKHLRKEPERIWDFFGFEVNPGVSGYKTLKDIRDICAYLWPEKVPKQYTRVAISISIWIEHTQNVLYKTILKEVSNYGKICDKINARWIDDLLALLLNDVKVPRSDIIKALDEYAVLPDQNGKFRKMSELKSTRDYADKEGFQRLLEILAGPPILKSIRGELMDPEIENITLRHDYTTEGDVSDAIVDWFETKGVTIEEKLEVAAKLLEFGGHDLPESKNPIRGHIWKTLVKTYNRFMQTDIEIRRCKGAVRLSGEVAQKVYKPIIHMLVREIQKFKTVRDFAQERNIDEEDAYEAINEVIAMFIYFDSFEAIDKLRIYPDEEGNLSTRRDLCRYEHCSDQVLDLRDQLFELKADGISMQLHPNIDNFDIQIKYVDPKNKNKNQNYMTTIHLVRVKKQQDLTAEMDASICSLYRPHREDANIPQHLADFALGLNDYRHVEAEFPRFVDTWVNWLEKKIRGDYTSSVLLQLARKFSPAAVAKLMSCSADDVKTIEAFLMRGEETDIKKAADSATAKEEKEKDAIKKKFTAEFAVYEQLRYRPVFKKVEWLSQSNSKTDISFTMNQRQYYMKKPTCGYEVKAIDQENVTHNFIVLTPSDEKGFTMTHDLVSQLQKSTRSEQYHAVVVSNVESGKPKITFLNPGSPLAARTIEPPVEPAPPVKPVKPVPGPVAPKKKTPILLSDDVSDRNRKRDESTVKVWTAKPVNSAWGNVVMDDSPTEVRLPPKSRVPVIDPSLSVEGEYRWNEVYDENKYMNDAMFRKMWYEWGEEWNDYVTISCGGSKQRHLDHLFNPEESIFSTSWDNYDRKEGIKAANAWISVQFKKHKLIVTHYTIAVTKISQPRSWVLEASNDGQNWTSISQVKDNPQLRREQEAVRTFPVRDTRAFSFLRIRQLENWPSPKNPQAGELRLNALDFYGKLVK